MSSVPGHDNLSGLTVATFLRSFLLGVIFALVPLPVYPAPSGHHPGLAEIGKLLAASGTVLVLTCVGDNGGFHYKKSLREMLRSRRPLPMFFIIMASPLMILEFSPYGMTSGSTASPGFNLRWLLDAKCVGHFSRIPHVCGHLNFIKPKQLMESSTYDRNPRHPGRK